MQQAWYIEVHGVVHGPYQFEQLRYFASSGQISPSTNVTEGTNGVWAPAANIAGLFAQAVVSQQIANPVIVSQDVRSIARVSTVTANRSYFVSPPAIACGLVGASMIIAGVFLPFFQVPIVGSVNYFTVSKPESIAVICIGGACAVSMLLRITWTATLGGSATLGLLCFRFVSAHLRLAQLKEDLREDLKDNPFRLVASAFAETASVHWGFAVLLIGSLAVLIAPMLCEFVKSSDRTGTILFGLLLAVSTSLSAGGFAYALNNSATKKGELGGSMPNPITTGQTIELGSLRITPTKVEMRPIKVQRSFGIGGQELVLPGPFILLHVKVENISGGQVFNPFAYAVGDDNFGNKLESVDDDYFVVDPKCWFGDLHPGKTAMLTLILRPMNPKAGTFNVRVHQTVDNKNTTGEWSISIRNDS